MADWKTCLAQGPAQLDVSKSFDQIGVMATVLVVVLGAFLFGVRYILMFSIPEQIKQMREDHARVLTLMREDAKADREHHLALVHLQRTEFLAALIERDRVSAVNADRVETNRTRIADDVLRRLDQLNALVAGLQKEQKEQKERPS